MGAASQALGLDDGAGDGQDILHRAADLGADHVVGQIGPERRPRDGLDQGPAQRLVRTGQGYSRGQAAGHLAGETRTGQHRAPGARHGVGGHHRHQLQRALLDPLGAQDYR